MLAILDCDELEIDPDDLLRQLIDDKPMISAVVVDDDFC
jgi:hypothetical protein